MIITIITNTATPSKLMQFRDVPYESGTAFLTTDNMLLIHGDAPKRFVKILLGDAVSFLTGNPIPRVQVETDSLGDADRVFGSLWGKVVNISLSITD
jgi:hypothetical protein